VVDRHVEEALDLPRMEIHREHPVDSGRLDHVGDEAGGDGLAGRGLLVLARVGEPWHDSRDAVRGGQLRRLDHDHELEQVVVRRLPVAGLDDEDVRAADGLAEPAVCLAVLERLELDLAELDVELVGDPEGEVGIRAARKEHELPGRAALDPAAALTARLGGLKLRDLEPRQPGQLSGRRSFHHGLPC
jgi:hypothetical protein